MSSGKYNGWSNYETWRVQLECINEEDYHDWCDRYTEDHPVREGKTSKVRRAYREEMAYALAEVLQEEVEQYAEERAFDLVQGWTMAFLSEVDWREIAWGICDQYCEWLEDKS